MFEKLTKKQKLKVIGSFVTTAFLGFVVIITVFLYLNPSLGWFSSNQVVNGSGMSIRVEYDDFYVEATYYRYDPKESVVKSSTDLSDIDLNPYDLVFQARNRYTPIVAALKITGNDVSSSGTLTVRINRNLSADPNGYYVDGSGNTHISEYFTSIMRVTPFVGASYYSTTAETLYRNIDTTENYEYVRSLIGNANATNAHPQSLVFTDVTMNGVLIDTVEKADYIDIEVDYSEDDFIMDDDVSTLIVYLYITYDEGYYTTVQNDVIVSHYDGLLGIYQSTSSHGGGIGTGGDIMAQAIHFDNDLSNIIVSHH